MRLLILTLLVCIAASATSAQVLRQLGSDVGGRVSSTVNSGIGTAVEPEILGIGGNPRRNHGPRGSDYHHREHEHGSSSKGRRGHERQGSSGEFHRGGSYQRDKIVREKERGSGFDSGRGRQGSERGTSSGRTDHYDRERSDYGRRRG